MIIRHTLSLMKKTDPTGFNVDLTHAIAKVMELKAEVQMAPWGDIRSDLTTGKIDVIAGMYYSKERAEMVDFSPPYTIVHHAIFARRDSPKIKSEKELKGKKIVVMRGDIMQDYLLKEGLSNNPGLADTQSKALQLLASGKYDFALIAKLPGLYWVKKLGLSNIDTVGPLIRPSAYCFAVKKGNAELLSHFIEGLAIVKKTGRMDKIYESWLGVLEPKGVPKATIFKYVGVSILLLVLILAGSVVWVRTLKSQVAQRTKALEEETRGHKKAEEALRESEALQRTIMNSLHAGVVIVDPLTRIIEQVNDHASALFGAPGDHLVGKRCHSFLCPANEGACPVCDLGQVVDNSEREMLRKDGTSLPILKTVNRVILNGQEKLLECFVDLSEQKLAEKTLRESEKKFSTLFHASPVYIALTTLNDGRFLDVNDAFTKVTGFERDEVIGRTPVEMGLWFAPEERSKYIELAQKYGGFHEEEVKFRKKNGDPLYGFWSVEKIESDGADCLISVFVDTTERKKAQEALRQERDKLRTALSEIKTLSGLVPICANCKKIRDDQGYWNQIEKYIGERSNAQFSHGICPECAKKLYPEFDLYDDGKLN